MSAEHLLQREEGTSRLDGLVRLRALQSCQVGDHGNSDDGGVDNEDESVDSENESVDSEDG